MSSEKKLSERLFAEVTVCEKLASDGTQQSPGYFGYLVKLLSEAGNFVREQEQKEVDEEFSQHQRALES